MKYSLKKTLRNEVLELEASEARMREQRGQLDALTAALSESTSLNPDKISAVLDNLHDEAANQPKRVLFKLPSISARSLRIAAYVVAGLIAFSVYKSAQIDTLQAEQQYPGTQQATHNFYLGLSELRSLLVSSYSAHYKEHDSFPHQAEQLDAVYPTTRYLDASDLVSGYTLSAGGIIRFKLSDNYGYNRWIELTPALEDHPLWLSITFNCRSNAQSDLLLLYGDSWCQHSN